MGSAAGGRTATAIGAAQAPTLADQLRLACYWFPLNVESSALLAIVVPEVLDRLAGPEHTRHLARLATAASLLAMAAGQAAGAISDRQRARGRPRRALVLFGAVLNVLALGWMASARGLGALTAGLLLATLGQTLSQAAYQPLLLELTPPELRGTASGYMGAASLLGSAAGLGVAGLAGPGPAYAAMAGTLLLGAFTTATLPEPAGPPPAERPVPVARGTRHDYAVAFLARLLLLLGVGLLNTFVLYFLQDDLHVARPGAGTAVVAGCALAGAAASSLGAGTLSDRFRRRDLAALAGAPMAATALAFALAPRPGLLAAYAVLFGLGYGAYLSVDWALALDTLPDGAHLARDLGVWGIAGGLPSVLAPALGGLVLDAAPGPAAGYRALFFLSGGCFVLGSLVVLRVGARPLSPLWTLPLRLAVAAGLAAYVRLAYRVRVWGRLPYRRGPTLLVANHQHDLDALAVLPAVYLGGPWRDPVFSLASQRLWERGFLATRAPRRLWPLVQHVRIGGVLEALGALPLENEPFTRPLASYADELARRHGDPPLEEVLTPEALRSLSGRTWLPLGGRRLHDLRGPQLGPAAWQPASPLALREPYRSEVRAPVRARIAAQLARAREVLRGGGTLYLTAEGHPTRGGRLRRPRAALHVLAPEATPYLAALSYDPLRGRRLSVLVRIVPPSRPDDLWGSLAAARPVTASQVVAACLLGRVGDGRAFSADAALAWALQTLAELPPGAWVDPELRRRPRAVLAQVLAALVRRRWLIPSGDGYILAERRHDPRFAAAGVEDILAHQAAAFEETCAALRRLAAARADP